VKAVDVSVISPVQVALLDQAARRPGAAITAGKASKARTHDEPCRAQGRKFVPLVVETFGGWDQDAVNHIREMAL
jgi:hypothetical protein